MSKGSRVDTVQQLAADPVQADVDDMTHFWSSLADVANELPMPYPMSESQNGTINTSRLDILMRTLVADTYMTQHPTPPKCATEFMSHICTELAREAIRGAVTPRSRWSNYLNIKWWLREFHRMSLKLSLARSFWHWPDRYFTALTRPWLELINDEPGGSIFHGSSVSNELVRIQHASSGSRYVDWSQALAQFRREFNLCSGRRR
ncbi:hypothetical protein G647_01595 [Cladophialophora carrionii CBS 160.54]|uniref:Uncharacterized protein n=1 Tax=Cladophialophora carrionii CBS 160.54 TaxID=1279043 RepID=V9DT38_9EURO|nr:uncharacterized protein G647_01595 [Cladophialophora carrionii CBS 160.54]ETI29142.1 hypothetical protein G647_01595 [Cladophialophora carrionii CBS 160.54]